MESTPAFLDAAWALGEQPGGILGYTASEVAPVGGEELLLVLLYALRNASFVISNGRNIGHSARAIQVFQGGVLVAVRWGSGVGGSWVRGGEIGVFRPGMSWSESVASAWEWSLRSPGELSAGEALVAPSSTPAGSRARRGLLLPRSSCSAGAVLGARPSGLRQLSRGLIQTHRGKSRALRHPSLQALAGWV